MGFFFLRRSAQNLHNFTYKTSSSQPKPAWGWTNFAMRFRRWKFPVPRPQEKQPLAAQPLRATSKGSNCRLTTLPGWNPMSAASPTKHSSFTEPRSSLLPPTRCHALLAGTGSQAPGTDAIRGPQNASCTSISSPAPAQPLLWWDAVGSALVAPWDAVWGARSTVSQATKMCPPGP